MTNALKNLQNSYGYAAAVDEVGKNPPKNMWARLQDTSVHAPQRMETFLDKATPVPGVPLPTKGKKIEMTSNISFIPAKTGEEIVLRPGYNMALPAGVSKDDKIIPLVMDYQFGTSLASPDYEVEINIPARDNEPQFANGFLKHKISRMELANLAMKNVFDRGLEQVPALQRYAMQALNFDSTYHQVGKDIFVVSKDSAVMGSYQNDIRLGKTTWDSGITAIDKHDCYMLPAHVFNEHQPKAEKTLKSIGLISLGDLQFKIRPVAPTDIDGKSMGTGFNAPVLFRGGNEAYDPVTKRMQVPQNITAAVHLTALFIDPDGIDPKNVVSA